ncbi:MAG: D-alanyl-D-alanine carboxypeptidase [Alphaproteobacteria bacterium]|nr:D-alanyl-D-alanine carboxypeptidase [Alphaproteobacteria bacterium]
MKANTLFSVLLLLVSGLANAAPATDTEFTTKAKSVFLMDYDSGTEIVAKDADVLMPPSSMIKLMTLAVLFDEIKSGNLTMDSKLPVSENADYKNPLWYPASKICLVAGQEITVRDAILGLIVLSGGDASVVVAEKLAGSENAFTAKMTAKARSIGMEQSTFGNASGLPDPNNLMTSRELAILATHIIGDYPDIYPMFATKRFEFGDYKSDWCRDWGRTHTVNYNKLLFTMPGADGLKTGHTDSGGYGMVASAKVGGRRLVGVINGFNGRGHDALAAEMKKLLNYGYTTTSHKVYYQPGDTVVAVPVWYGRVDTVSATVEKPFAVTLPKPVPMSSIRVLARFNEPAPAPIAVGDKLGEIIAEYDGRVIAHAPLVAAERVQKVRFFKRLVRNISVMIRGK